MIKEKKQNNSDRQLFLLIFSLAMIIFIFTNDGHRYTWDEDIVQRQSAKFVEFIPDPRYEQGTSRIWFDMGIDNTHLPICRFELLCSGAFIGHTALEVPFIFINHHFDIISDYTVTWTSEDFNDPHYVWWRNSLPPDMTFLELFYGPIFSSLSVGTFFLVSRTLSYSRRISILISCLFGFSTTVWAYSQTTFNLIPLSFFILLGVYYFLNYLKNDSKRDLVISGCVLGIAFLIREDAILTIGVTLIFMLVSIVKRNEKLKKIIFFVASNFAFLLLSRLIDYIRFIPEKIQGGSYVPHVGSKFPLGSFGLLFSPGLGLLIFYPITLTCFFSFFDFYKKHKLECIYFISLISTYVLFYGSIDYWHGMNAWAARYLLSVVPFFLLPLGASIATRNRTLMSIVLIGLGGFSFFTNIVFVIQDQHWFVWGVWGSKTGLTSLGSGLTLHPATLWSFEYSQLIHTIIAAFTRLQPDVFLLKLFGFWPYLLTFVSMVMIPIFFIIKIARHEEPNHIKESL